MEEATDPVPSLIPPKADAVDLLFNAHCGSDGVIDAFELQTILNELLHSDLNAHGLRSENLSRVI